MRERLKKIPYKFTDKDGVDWVVSARFPLEANDTEFRRLIATDKVIDDMGKRYMRVLPESEIRSLLPKKNEQRKGDPSITSSI